MTKSQLSRLKTPRPFCALWALRESTDCLVYPGVSQLLILQNAKPVTGHPGSLGWRRIRKPRTDGLARQTSVVHFHANHLALPISSFLTILTILLPILALLNAYIYPNLLRSSHSLTTGHLASRLAPLVLQGLQAVVTAILATLLLKSVIPSPVLDFLVEYEWDELYRRNDATHVLSIQDTYDCCGLNAVNDRACPFVSAPGRTCAELHGRTSPCRRPWQTALRCFSGIDFGVVVVVALMQMAGLLMMRERTAWWTALRTEDWKPSDTDAGSGRRLFTVQEESEGSSLDRDGGVAPHDTAASWSDAATRDDPARQ
ncbi:hypothetical protein E4U42_006239 [Claviceps africana]|uniref:Tetraspanin Tsp3 n=1 Tax=Claviceps africana TaxID=83212 RepID=A0A8K0JBG3_9HYPO|nr:hypothetical protein E4U42_006239 [Claviceps africana]